MSHFLSSCVHKIIQNFIYEIWVYETFWINEYYYCCKYTYTRHWDWSSLLGNKIDCSRLLVLLTSIKGSLSQSLTSWLDVLKSCEVSMPTPTAIWIKYCIRKCMDEGVWLSVSPRVWLKSSVTSNLYLFGPFATVDGEKLLNYLFHHGLM